MLVSAVSANHFQASRIVDKDTVIATIVNTEDTAKKAFNSSNISQKGLGKAERLSLYESINEWKDFCHKQIMNGKLDVVV
jgi:hypothetical protein